MTRASGDGVRSRRAARPRVRRAAAAAPATVLAAALLACRASPPPPPAASVTSATAGSRFEVAETIFDGGWKNGWQDGGGAPHEIVAGSAARVRFSDLGQWVLVKPGLTGAYGGVSLRVKAPPDEGEFLELRLASGSTGDFPRVKVSPDDHRDLAGGWTEIFVPIGRLDPTGIPFDRVVLHAFRPYVTEWVQVDRVALTKPLAAAPEVAAAAAASGASGALRIACDARATKISPLIYGFGGGADAATWAASGVAAHRWGGNPTSRYNWEIHAINLAQDWYFENRPSGAYTDFFAENAAHGALGALTVPMIGWVAKDTTSFSFPVSVFGAQGKTDPWRPDAGDGTRPSGATIAPGPATRTSVAAPPEWVGRWVQAIVAADKKAGTRSVAEYILDNEPMLWHVTHRDVRTEPLGYDELLERTIAYGTAIRKADPGAVIAGPAEWGWPNYFYSAKDMAAGLARKPDRRAHGDTPLVEWYLRRLREHEQKTGTRVLDVLDLHYYPQAEGVYGGGTGGTDLKTQLLRLRSTRSLWAPGYVDESWVGDVVRLLPRMNEWVAANDPGLGISIGEWNFGGQTDITGALATAEALGRFAQFGVRSAFYWTMPPAGSPSLQGFAAYRNFDGKGARFLDYFVPTTSPDGVSLFASRDETGTHLVAVAINMSPGAAVRARLDVSTCGAVATRRTYVYERGAAAFAARGEAKGGSPSFDEVLPPWSITVIDLRLADAIAGAIEK